jgi:hypothetical protein
MQPEDGSHTVGRVLSFFSSRRNWDSPNLSPAGECAAPPPPGSGGRGTLAGEREGGRVTIRTRGYTRGTLYIYVLCDGSGTVYSREEPDGEGFYQF